MNFGGTTSAFGNSAFGSSSFGSTTASSTTGSAFGNSAFGKSATTTTAATGFGATASNQAAQVSEFVATDPNCQWMKNFAEAQSKDSNINSFEFGKVEQEPAKGASKQNFPHIINEAKFKDFSLDEIRLLDYIANKAIAIDTSFKFGEEDVKTKQPAYGVNKTTGFGATASTMGTTAKAGFGQASTIKMVTFPKDGFFPKPEDYIPESSAKYFIPSYHNYNSKLETNTLGLGAGNLYRDVTESKDYSSLFENKVPDTDIPVEYTPSQSIEVKTINPTKNISNQGIKIMDNVVFYTENGVASISLFMPEKIQNDADYFRIRASDCSVDFANSVKPNQYQYAIVTLYGVWPKDEFGVRSPKSDVEEYKTTLMNYCNVYGLTFLEYNEEIGLFQFMTEFPIINGKMMTNYEIP